MKDRRVPLFCCALLTAFVAVVESAGATPAANRKFQCKTQGQPAQVSVSGTFGAAIPLQLGGQPKLLILDKAGAPTSMQLTEPDGSGAVTLNAPPISVSKLSFASHGNDLVAAGVKSSRGRTDFVLLVWPATGGAAVTHTLFAATGLLQGPALTAGAQALALSYTASNRGASRFTVAFVGPNGRMLQPPMGLSPEVGAGTAPGRVMNYQSGFAALWSDGPGADNAGAGVSAAVFGATGQSTTAAFALQWTGAFALQGASECGGKLALLNHDANKLRIVNFDGTAATQLLNTTLNTTDPSFGPALQCVPQGLAVARRVLKNSGKRQKVAVSSVTLTGKKKNQKVKTKKTSKGELLTPFMLATAEANAPGVYWTETTVTTPTGGGAATTSAALWSQALRCQ